MNIIRFIIHFKFDAVTLLETLKTEFYQQLYIGTASAIFWHPQDICGRIEDIKHRDIFHIRNIPPIYFSIQQSHKAFFHLKNRFVHRMKEGFLASFREWNSIISSKFEGILHFFRFVELSK